MGHIPHSNVWHDPLGSWHVDDSLSAHLVDEKMTHSYVSQTSFKCVTWLMHMCDVTHSYVQRDSFTCVTRLIECAHLKRKKTECIYVWWLVHMCDMTHPHVWHDSFTRVTWLIECTPCWEHTRKQLMHTCHVFICVTWLIHMCDMSHSHVWHDPLTPSTACYLLPGKVSFFLFLQVGLGISRTIADSQWNLVYKAFHRLHRCRNETIRR